jgi:probable F420-dependent oxidoreductase
MSVHRPFRFGVFASTAAGAWPDQVCRAETLGYASLAVGEHIFANLAPISALASAAMVTSTIRLASLTFANDFRNPLLLAKEVASLDVLSGGRVEFGLGSGFYRTDYDQTGIPFDPPGVRIDRLFEAVRLIKRAFVEETIDHAGTHYAAQGFSLVPSPVQRPRPPLLIGGGSRRVLTFAAQEADIVSLNIRSTREGGFDWGSVGPESIAQKVAWVREAAGDRFPALELHWIVIAMAVTDRPRDAAREVIEMFGAAGAITPEELLASPQALIGSEEAIVEKIERNRDEYGVSHLTVFAPAMEPFAPIVARLAGSKGG